MTERFLLWQLDQSQIEYDISTLPWLTDANPDPDLCKLCRHLDFTFLYIKQLQKIKFNYKDKPHRVHSNGITFATITDLRERKERCKFCNTIWLAMEDRFNMNDIDDEGAPLKCYLNNSTEGLWGATSGDEQPFRLVIEVIFDTGSLYRKKGNSGDSVYIACDDSKLGLSHKLDSTVSTDWMLKQLQICNSTHGGHPGPCPLQIKNNHMETRFIDVNQLCIVQRSTEDTRYVALSYCWGGASCVTLDQSNMSDLHRIGGMQEYLHRIPLTIRDAMTFCRQIEAKYLWVDGLCIVQDSGEKIEQINRMNRIYENAYVAIAAAAGSDANAGIAGISPRTSFRHTVNVQNLQLVTLAPDSVEQSVWNTRAWTYQERLLSPRMFISTDQEVLYCCRHGTSRESKRLNIHDYPEFVSCIEPPTDNNTLNPTQVIDFNLYVRTVFEYSHRKMTSNDDVINALQGLITVISENFTQHEFEFGFPVHLLDISLLWRGVQPLTRRKGWPSWSWVGWVGAVSYGGLIDLAERTRTRLIPVDGPAVSMNTDDWDRNADEDGIYYTDKDPDRWYCRPGLKEIYLNAKSIIKSGILECKARVANFVVSTDRAADSTDTWGLYGRHRTDLSSEWSGCGYFVVDEAGDHAGVILIDGNSVREFVHQEYRFVCLSQTTYTFGDSDPAWNEDTQTYSGEPGSTAINPQDVEEDDYYDGGPRERRNDDWFDSRKYEFNICWALYNVMMINDNNERLGIGKIHIHAFDKIARVEHICLR